MRRAQTLTAPYRSSAPNWGDHLDARFFLREHLAKLHGKRVLDAACNQGFLLESIPADNERFGFDIDAGFVRVAKARVPRARVVRASLYQMPYATRSFDVVVAANVVPGADFPETPSKLPSLRAKFASELARVLKPGGGLYFTTPNNARYHTVKLSRDDVQSLLEPHFSFEIKSYNPFPDFPFFLPSRVMAAVPGWRSLLGKMCEKGWFVGRGKTFYVKAFRKK